jgi:hypothetical protein
MLFRKAPKGEFSSSLPTTHYQLLTSRRGSLLLDALLSVAIFGVIVGAFSSGITGGQQGTVRGGNRTRATYLAEEGLEAVRSIRDAEDGFDVIAARTKNDDDGVQLSGSNWTIVDAPTTIDTIFTRKVVFSDGPGGPSDNDGRKVTSTVSWIENPGNLSMSVVLETYLTNWHAIPDPPVPDWSQPFLAANLAYANESFEKVVVVGNYAYVVGSVTSQPGFYKFDLTNLAAPPDTAIVNSGTSRAYDITISGNYAYVATSDTSAANPKIKILDITQADIVCCAATVSVPGIGALRGITIAGSKLYTVQGGDAAANEFMRYQMNTPTSLVADGGFNDDTRSMYDVTIKGNYAYVAEDENPGETAVFDISQYPNPTLVGGIDIPSGGAYPAYAIAQSTNGIFLGTDDGAGWQLYGFDIIADPLLTNPPADSSLDIGGFSTSCETIFDIAVSDAAKLAFLATNKRTVTCGLGQVRHYFQIANIANPNNIPALVYGGSDFDSATSGTTKGGKGIFFQSGFPERAVLVVGQTGIGGGSDILVLQPTYN